MRQEASAGNGAPAVRRGVASLAAAPSLRSIRGTRLIMNEDTIWQIQR